MPCSRHKLPTMSGFQHLTEQYWHNVGFDKFDGEQGVALIMGPATKMWAIDFDVAHAVRDDLLAQCRTASGGRSRLAPPTFRRHSVEAWNHCASAATGDVLIQLSDDMVPDSHWDRKLLELLGSSPCQLLGQIGMLLI